MSTAAKYELRFTETNSADDSAGKTWGLEGNLLVRCRRSIRGGDNAATALQRLALESAQCSRASGNSTRNGVALRARFSAGQASGVRHRSFRTLAERTRLRS